MEAAAEAAVGASASATDQAPVDIIEHLLQQNPHLRPRAERPVSLARRALQLWRALPVAGRWGAPTAAQELMDRLLAQQARATSYRAWHAASVQLDVAAGHDAWKAVPHLCHYDHQLVQRHLDEMRAARTRNDYRRLLYLVRTRWTRNVGNMGTVALYRLAHVGTKQLVEQYIEECRALLHYLVHDPAVHLDDRYLLGMLVQTRRNIGRTALVLSGGSTFSLSHVGVLAALLENNLVPRIVSGLLSGSIIASILCCHTNEEIGTLLRSITDRRFAIFGADSAHDGRLKRFLARIAHLLKFGTFFDIAGLRETMYDFVGNMTFREAYNRTGKILNVTVSPAGQHEQTRLLNHLTAPHCLVWSAICALCSLPGIFPSNSIYEKNPSTGMIHEWNNDLASKYVDGSVDGDLPISRLLEMFNVDHIIAVQVNPHVAPVLNVSVGPVGGKVDSDLSHGVRVLLNNAYDFVTNEIIHCLQILHEMNIYQNLTSKLIALLSQQYSGDITILPQLHLTDFLKVFKNPTPQFIIDFILKGAQAAWPKITVINNHCGVEFALDKEISFLRGRLIASANNRIACPSTDAQDPTLSGTFDTSCYLVTSPVLSKEAPISPKARSKALIRRHNLLTDDSKWLRHSPLRKKTASFLERGSARGHSSISLKRLAAKSDATEQKKGPSTPSKRNAHPGGDSFFTTGERTKAVFDFAYSPHHEKTLYFNSDYPSYALPKSKLMENDQKETANLPKVLRNGSVRASHSDLHRLKSRSKSILDLEYLTTPQSQKVLETLTTEKYNQGVPSSLPVSERQSLNKRLQAFSSDRKSFIKDKVGEARDEYGTTHDYDDESPGEIRESGEETESPSDSRGHADKPNAQGNENIDNESLTRNEHETENFEDALFDL